MCMNVYFKNIYYIEIRQIKINMKSVEKELTIIVCYQ